MPITAAAIGFGGSLLGGLSQGSSARRAAEAQSRAQIEAARIAAEEARFRPVGITSRFGRSMFEYGPEGRVTGAGYELSPELRAYQDRLMGLAGRGLTQAEEAQDLYAPLMGAAGGLFGAGQQYLTTPADQRMGELAGQYLRQPTSADAISALGEKYIAQSPEEAAQQYMAKQQDLLAPSRERQYSQLQNQLFQTGRGGLSVGATGARPSGAAGLGATTPETEAYYNAIAQQDAALAAQAQQAGQQQAQFGAGLLGTGQALGQRQIGFGADLLGRQQALEQGRLGFGAGLFGTAGNLLGQMYGGQAAALGPYQAYLGGATSLESLGQQPLELGSALGGRIANPYGGAYLLKGGMEAAGSQYKADAYNPFATALTMGSRNPQFNQLMSNLFQGGAAPALDYSSPIYGGYSLNQLQTMPYGV